MTITTSPDRQVSDTARANARVSDTPLWLSDTAPEPVRQVSDSRAQVSDTARRARRQATAVAAVGAIVPTVLAAQGMTYLAIDLLGFPVLAAVALASFLELALVSSALLARAAALAGRPGGADAIAVWVVSATSGLLAGVHELVATPPGGGSTWTTDPGSWLAAAVRAVAPLVAAWLWERVLQAARAEQAERTLAEVRRDRRFLEVGRRALAVRRLETAGRAAWRVRRARRRLDRAHLAALRSVPPAAELLAVLAAVGQVDVLPDATRPRSDTPATSPDVAAADVGQPSPPLPEVSDSTTQQVTPGTGPTPRAPLLSDTPGATVRQVSDTPDLLSDSPDLPSGVPGAGVRRLSDTFTKVSDSAPTGSAASPAPASTVTPVSEITEPPSATRRAGGGHLADTPASEGPEPLAVALELVRADRSVSGSRVADALARHGVPVSERTGLRWRNRALEVLAAR